MTEEGENQGSNSRACEWDTSMDDEDNNDLLLLNDELNLNTSSLRSDKKYIGFDNNAGDSWIFPSNFPERAYQYNIVQKALFHNTLVVLPTGLGKTFIAAVVMYNIYRWYPMGKVIFMAPTRPLVTQQIEACVKIMGIPKEHSVELTGKLNKASRAQFWQSKRVFFATPQSVQSDILDEEVNFPFDAVKLIVVDEAHRAKGRYAYTEVIRYIWSKNKFFRILALSATPGRRKEDVEVVIRNLFISNLEVRTEESVDVVSYVHKRQLKVVVVNLGTKLSKIRDELLEIVDPHLRNLIDNRLISGRPGSISRNWLVMEHKRFREMTQNNSVPMQKELNSDFNICISVYHAIELLERHGLRVFLNNFDENQENGPKFVVILRPDLRRLIQKIRDEAGPNPFAYSDQCMLDGEIAPIPPNIDFGHPKFEIAREHVLAHFESNKEARVIVFCEYRESVMLMHRLLLQHRPVIRPRLFVGQGGCGSIRAVTQQQQINVMNDFKSGKSNALIATSVAEEGIDVGEVDLIVCFDINTSNPTRFIQRIGRTGRQKEGKVLLLATEGKEHAMLKEVLSERNRLNKSLSRGGQFNSAFYNQSPRMVPTEFNPKCMKLFIQVPQSEELPKSKDKASKRTTVKGNRFAQVTQKKDLRHFFKQRAPLDEEDREVFAEAPSSSSKKSPPKTKNTKSSDLNETPAGDISEATAPVSPPPSPPVPKNTPANNKLFKKMAKYIRNTQNPQPIETLKAMTSNKLSKNSLQFLIEFSPDILPKVWARMQELWQKGIDENNIPIRGITNEDRLTIRAYLQIVNNFGSKESVEELIEAKKISAKAISYSALSEEYKSIFGDLEPGGISENNFDYLMEKFDEISSDEFSKSSYVRSMVYEDEIDELNQTSSVFNESSHNYSNDYIMDSKYMSQWGDTTTSSSHVHQPANPSVNAVQNPITFTEPVVAPAPTNDSDDDDVVFVGSTTAHQSTPIRAGPHKQALLNFNGTPIISSALKRRSHKTPPPKAKNSQKNMLDFVKASKISPNIGNTKRDPSKEVEPPSELNKAESQEENTMNFFDDQFDDIIAANSVILEHIENSNNVLPSEKTLKDIAKPSTSRTTYGDQEKTPVSKARTNLASDESTPDDVIPLVEDTTEKTDAPNSTPTGVICSSSIRHEDEQKLATTESQGECEGVYSEVAGIDFDLSEFAIDDIIDSQKSNPPAPMSKSLSRRCSPDIFAELCESISEQSKVPKEKSPVRLIYSPPAQASPCLLTKKTLTWREIREKYIKPSQVEKADTSRPTVADQPDESVITVPTKSRLKRRIITSDTESSNSDKDSSSSKRTRKNDVESCESITDSPSIRRPNRRIQSGKLLSRRSLQKVTHLRRKRTLKNDFIDDEAALSGSATEDEFEHTIGQYIQDSVIVDDDESENESSVPMTQVYLQSVRSPRGNIRGGFKIPERRQYNDTLKIFSQQVPPEDNGSYVTDSFVVISDDEPDVEKSMCPLERAEEILKNKRRTKRRAKLDGITEECMRPAAKKKRVLRMHNSSEDNDDFV